MANRIFGEARCSLADGRELTLRFDFNAMAEAEDAANKTADQISKEMSTGQPRMKTARAMFYGGLREHHPEISLEEAGDLILTDPDAISDAMGKAMEEMVDRRAAANPLAGAVLAKAKPSRGNGTRSLKAGARPV